MRTILSALVLSFAALPAGAQTSALTQPVVVPFTLNEGLVFIEATLGDSTPLNVILDTGGGLDVLSPRLVQRVSGKAMGVVTGHRMTGERLDIDLWVVPSLKVGALTRTNAVVGTWAALDNFGLDGIVSLDGFRNHPFTIDFGANTVTFESSGSLARRRANGRVSQLQLDDLRGRAVTAFAEFELGGKSGQCELDTGSQATRANTRYLTALGIDTSNAEVSRRTYTTAAGGTESQYVATVSRVSLASAPEVSASDVRVIFSDIIYDCVIGTDFWRDRTLTLDIGGRQLIVAR